MTMNNTNGGLTPKQARFAAEYLVDLNASAAARRAGYSERTAEQQGCRLLRNVKVAARIASLQDKTAKRLEVTVDSIMADLEDLCRGAVRAGQFGPAVRAKELMGKRLGMFADRVIVNEIQQLSDEELVKSIAGGDPRREALARELLAPDSFDDAETRH